MATVSDIVRVDIALDTAGVGYATFGIPLIAGPALFSERVRAYNNSQAAGEDIALSPRVKSALQTMFSQDRKPRQVKVGRREVSAFTVEVEEGHVVAVGDSFAIAFGDVTTAAVTGETTADAVMTALAADITGKSDMPVTAASSGGTLTLTFKTGKMEPPKFTGPLQYGTFTTTDTAKGISDDLTAINAEDEDWYQLLPVSRVADVVKGAAAWVEGHGSTEQPKIMGTASADPDIADASKDDDLLTQLKDKQYNRTFLGYDPQAATEFEGAAVIGRMAPEDPGSGPWGNTKLRGVTVSKRISPTQRGVVLKKNGNTFEYYGRTLALFNPGKMVSGEWIDIVVGRDWLANKIQVDMVNLIVNHNIPYTNLGIGICENNLRASLVAAQEQGVVAPDEFDSEGNLVRGFIIERPNAVEISDAQKASRQLLLKFRARVAGWIQTVEVSGSLAYSLV